MRRNPFAVGSVREWTQGVDAMDAVAAFGGFAAATMLPSYLIKPSTAATPLTNNQKILKVVAAVVAALGVGLLAKNMMGAGAGKAAVIGGLTGAGAQAITSFTTVKINPIALPMGYHIGESVNSPRPTDDRIIYSST